MIVTRLPRSLYRLGLRMYQGSLCRVRNKLRSLPQYSARRALVEAIGIVLHHDQKVPPPEPQGAADLLGRIGGTAMRHGTVATFC